MFRSVLVSTFDALEEMIKHLGGVPYFAWDHETRSADYVADPGGALKRMTMLSDLVSFATPDRVAYVVPLNMVTIPHIPEKDFFDSIRPVMENKRILKVGWNTIFDMHAMANYDVWVTHYADAMIMGWLLDNTRGNGLKERCVDVGYELHKFDFKPYWEARAQVTGEKPREKRKKAYTRDDVQAMEAEYTKYSEEDSIASLLLFEKYREELKAESTFDLLFWKHRNAAVRTLFNMERRGIPIDRKYLEEQAALAEKDRDAAEAAVFAAVGKHFNINSTKVLASVLYDDLGLPVKGITPKGAPSTNKGALDALAQRGYTVAQRIIEYRRIQKLLTTYLGTGSKLHKQIYEWDHLHPSFHPTGTSTGRLSSSDPNSQNFPRSNPKSYHFRRAIRASPGYKLIGGDFSQIELRVMAHMSQDPVMCSEYRKDAALKRALEEGMPLKEAEAKFGKSDIHQLTADGCKCSRQLAKSVNFGLLYGMFSNKLGSTLTTAAWDAMVDDGNALSWDPQHDAVDEYLAKEYYDAFFARYTGVRAYQEVVGRRVDLQGYIETRYGQRRRLPDAFSSDYFLKATARRQGVNTTIQGHVGELMLLLMHRADKDPTLRRLGYRLFLQVHDEVLGEASEECAEEAKTRLTQIFQNPAKSTESYPFSGYRVPLIFEAKLGNTWHDVH